jgi:hypothetical protein
MRRSWAALQGPPPGAAAAEGGGAGSASSAAPASSEAASPAAAGVTGPATDPAEAAFELPTRPAVERAEPAAAAPDIGASPEARGQDDAQADARVADGALDVAARALPGGRGAGARAETGAQAGDPAVVGEPARVADATPRAAGGPRRSIYHGVTWSRTNGKWRAQARRGTPTTSQLSLSTIGLAELCLCSG